MFRTVHKIVFSQRIAFVSHCCFLFLIYWFQFWKLILHYCIWIMVLTLIISWIHAIGNLKFFPSLDDHLCFCFILFCFCYCYCFFGIFSSVCILLAKVWWWIQYVWTILLYRYSDMYKNMVHNCNMLWSVFTSDFFDKQAHDLENFHDIFLFCFSFLHPVFFTPYWVL